MEIVKPLAHHFDHRFVQIPRRHGTGHGAFPGLSISFDACGTLAAHGTGRGADPSGGSTLLDFPMARLR